MSSYGQSTVGPLTKPFGNSETTLRSGPPEGRLYE